MKHFSSNNTSFVINTNQAFNCYITISQGSFLPKGKNNTTDRHKNDTAKKKMCLSKHK